MNNYGVTGSQGFTGLRGITGTQGSTGIKGIIISEDEWDNPIQFKENGTIYFRVRNIIHCPFGPAVLNIGDSAWYIKGSKLEDKDVKVVQSILENIKLAPLYLNDPMFRYTARWVLKNFGGGGT